MPQPSPAPRIRLSSAALVIAGICFALYPAIRPFSDEASLQGAAAFASTSWLAAHILAVLAFTLLPVGLFGLHASARPGPPERLAYGALILTMVAVGLILPFYGGEAFGLHAIGREAMGRRDAGLLEMAGVVRSGAGLAMFLGGSLLLVVAAIMATAAILRSGGRHRWSGIPLALGFALYIPQFFWTQPFRVAHGLLVAGGCIYMAAGLLLNGAARRQSP
jgi:hypothetical protein